MVASVYIRKRYPLKYFPGHATKSGWLGEGKINGSCRKSGKDDSWSRLLKIDETNRTDRSQAAQESPEE